MPQDYLSYKDKRMDGRVVILPEQYPEIIEKYKTVKSSRLLAKEYGCDKGTILKIVSERYRTRLENYAKGRWKIYYNKDEHTKAIKKYREKKKKFNLIIYAYTRKKNAERKSASKARRERGG